MASLYFVTCTRCKYYYSSKSEFSQCGKCGQKKNEGFDLPNWIRFNQDKGMYELRHGDKWT